MAKKIPSKGDALAQAAQAEIMVATFDKMQYAKAIYDHQNGATRDAIDRMQSLLIRISRKQMKVGTGMKKMTVEIPKDAIWNTAFYMAVEMLKDLAYMDIRVADFNWPEDQCMTCGKPVKAKRKKARA